MARQCPASGVRTFQFDQIVELADGPCPFCFPVGQLDSKGSLNVADDVQIIAISDQVQRVFHAPDRLTFALITAYFAFRWFSTVRPQAAMTALTKSFPHKLSLLPRIVTFAA